MSVLHPIEPDTDENGMRRALAYHRRQAIEHLRKAGMMVEVIGNTNRIRVITENVLCEYGDDTFMFLVDRHDLTRSISQVSTIFTPGDFPKIVVGFRPKPFNLWEVPEGYTDEMEKER